MERCSLFFLAVCFSIIHINRPRLHVCIVVYFDRKREDFEAELKQDMNKAEGEMKSEFNNKKEQLRKQVQFFFIKLVFL